MEKTMISGEGLETGNGFQCQLPFLGQDFHFVAVRELGNFQVHGRNWRDQGDQISLKKIA
jgi:hypothetical protein